MLEKHKLMLDGFPTQLVALGERCALRGPATGTGLPVARKAFWLPWDAIEYTRSLCLDAEFLDERPPFLCIGFHKSSECLWRLLLTRENLKAQFREP